MSKILFLAICLVSCTSIPKPPQVEQDGYSVKFKKFRACNTETHVCRNISRDDPSMEGAQCLNASDFKSMNSWIDQLIDMLSQRNIQSVEVLEE